MRKVILLAIALVVIAAPAMAATVTFDQGAIFPLVNGVPQVLELNPGTKPVLDLYGNFVIDPITGLPKTENTWVNYMAAARLGLKTYFQGVTLEKIHPYRKAACGFEWPVETIYDPTTNSTVVRQVGKDNITLFWPLLYEVDGTMFKLTVNYATDQLVAIGNTRASRVHTDVYIWTVRWNTLQNLLDRLTFFSRLPAGTCEVPAVTQYALKRILVFLNGFGSPAFGNWDPGILQLVAAGRLGDAAIKFGALEDFIDAQGCINPCGFGSGAINAQGIVNNSTVPAASVLLNDVWAVGKALGVLLK